MGSLIKKRRCYRSSSHKRCSVAFVGCCVVGCVFKIFEGFEKAVQHNEGLESHSKDGSTLCFLSCEV